MERVFGPIPFWLARLALAALLGGLVGLERETHGRPAGLRTHLLVCLGAALVTLAGVLLARDGAARLDDARIPAAVMTGIGFLGAGAILRTGDGVRGLTTAATLWFAAGLGVTAGLGLAALAAAATALALGTLVGLRAFERRLAPASWRELRVSADGVDRAALEDACRAALAAHPLHVEAVETELTRVPARVTLTFRLALRGSDRRADITERLAALAGVRRVIWRLPRDPR